MRNFIVVSIIFWTVGLAKAQPTGTIVAYAGPKNGPPPVGWAWCDGTQIPNTPIYANIKNVIGTIWGGNGTTTWYFPDLRGVFLRGVTENSSNDPDATLRGASRPDIAAGDGNEGNNVGSRQIDGIKEHTHTLTGGTFTFVVQHPSDKATGGSDRPLSFPNQSHTITVNPQGNGLNPNETRPKNVYVYYIIKL